MPLPLPCTWVTQMQHCSTRCVELQPAWAKGYGRVSAAAQLAHRPGEAEAALKKGLKACPAGEAVAL